MKQATVSVVVFAVPWRASHEKCFASIEASDIGKNYTVCKHPEGMHKNDHWFETHLLASKCESDLVLVLEDDVIVNEHILWNISTWCWTRHKEFRAGWLMNVGGRSGYDEWFVGEEWCCTQGVVYRPSKLGKMMEHAWPRIQTGMPWDCAISWAAGKEGRIRTHMPSLVEHLDHLPSVVGNEPSVQRTSLGTFDAKWKRPLHHQHGILDEYGRERQADW